MKHICLLFILFFTAPIFAQQSATLTAQQIEEDYTIFKTILTTAHPSLYEYTSAQKWDSLFNDFEQNQSKKIKTATDLFKSISNLANHVKDGHLSIQHPQLATVPPMFPLLLKICNKKLYTDTDEFDIELGSEILAINKIYSKDLLNAMLKYAPSDGYNLTKKYRQIEKNFSILLYYEYGEQKEYTVTYKPPKGLTKTKTIQSQPFTEIGKRYINRSSHFANYHKNTDKRAYFLNRIAQKQPFVYFIDSVNTAVLTVHSFGIDPHLFATKITALFKQIKKKKVCNLVIDIRQNLGGYRTNAIQLFRFLTTQPFQQRIAESTLINTLPAEKYLVHTPPNDYAQFFMTYFATAQQANQRWTLTTDHAQKEMIPVKKPFKGKIYVLIGGNTFSAASALALNAKNNPQITLVGEETGGGYYFHTGQYPAHYQLPHSNIQINLSVVKVTKYVQDTTLPKGCGIPPDYTVPLTLKDLINGTDAPLNFVLQHIAQKQ